MNKPRVRIDRTGWCRNVGGIPPVFPFPGAKVILKRWDGQQVIIQTKHGSRSVLVGSHYRIVG
jgi:hypothetical protein